MDLPPDPEIADWVLSLEKDRIVLRTGDGLLLWSDTPDRQNRLGDILERAKQVLAIRKKIRKKNPS